MPQGARGWWVRAARMSLSAVLCAGAIGCMNTDKPPPPKFGANNTRPITPQPGLPGLQPLPGATTGPGTMGNNTRPGQPAFNPPGSNGLQPAGGFATGPGTQPPRPTIGQPVVPAGGPLPPPSFVPPTGPVTPAGGIQPPTYSNPQSYNPPPPNLNDPLPPAPPAQPGGIVSGSNYGGPIAPPPPVPPTRPQPHVYADGSIGIYKGN